MSIVIDSLRKDIDEIRSDIKYSYYHVTQWERMENTICSNMNETIEFIKNGCTDEEVRFIAGVVEEVMERTHNRYFLETVKARAELIKDPQWKEDLRQCIKNASVFLD